MIDYDKLEKYQMNVISLITLLLFCFPCWLNGQSAEEYNQLGNQRMAGMDYKMAIVYYEKAIEKNSKKASFHFNLGYAKYSNKDYIGAIHVLSNGLEINGDDSFALSFRADAKVKVEDFRGAILDANKALQLGFKYDVNYVMTYKTRAMCRVALDDYTGALSDYNKSIQYEPKNGHSFYMRSFVKRWLGDNDGACLDLSKAGELGYTDAYTAISQLCK